MVNKEDGSEIMDKREELTWQIWRMDGMGRTLLIAGLISFIPILNIILAGYYALWTRRLLDGERLDLPDWAEWRAMLDELVRTFPIFLFWGLFPWALAAIAALGIYGAFDFLFLDPLAYTLGFIPLSAAAVLVPPAIVQALILCHREGHWRAGLDLQAVIQPLVRRARALLFPLLQYYGILLLGWPLLSFTAFLATLPLIAQLLLVLREPGKA